MENQELINLNRLTGPSLVVLISARKYDKGTNQRLLQDKVLKIKEEGKNSEQIVGYFQNTDSQANLYMGPLFFPANLMNFNENSSGVFLQEPTNKLSAIVTGLKAETYSMGELEKLAGLLKPGAPLIALSHTGKDFFNVDLMIKEEKNFDYIRTFYVKYT